MGTKRDGKVTFVVSSGGRIRTEDRATAAHKTPKMVHPCARAAVRRDVRISRDTIRVKRPVAEGDECG